MAAPALSVFEMEIKWNIENYVRNDEKVRGVFFSHVCAVPSVFSCQHKHCPPIRCVVTVFVFFSFRFVCVYFTLLIRVELVEK